MIDKDQQKKEFDQAKFVFCIQSAFDIHYSKGSSENIWDNQSSKYQETGLKRKKNISWYTISSTIFSYN